MKLGFHFYMCLYGMHKDDPACTLLKGGNVERYKKNLRFRFFVAQTLYNLVKDKSVDRIFDCVVNVLNATAE